MDKVNRSFTPADLPDTFYRISAKALIFDSEQRLLVFMDDKQEWEIPGGGWNRDESFEQCIKRELYEEAKLRVTSIDSQTFCYKGTYKFRGGNDVYFPKISIAARVTANTSAMAPNGDDLVELRFVTKAEFLRLPFQHGEASVQQHAGQIWPA